MAALHVIWFDKIKMTMVLQYSKIYSIGICVVTLLTDDMRWAKGTQRYIIGIKKYTSSAEYKGSKVAFATYDNWNVRLYSGMMDVVASVVKFNSQTIGRDKLCR